MSVMLHQEHPVFTFAYEGNFEDLKGLISEDSTLLSKKSSNSNPVIAFAIEAGHLEMVQWLVKQGANIHEKNAEGKTALMLAINAGQLEIVRWLVEKAQVNLHERDSAGNMALMIAVCKGHLNIIRFLSEKGARNKENQEGLTPLDVAIQNKQDEIVSCLLKYSHITYTDIRKCWNKLLEDKDSYTRTLIQDELNKINKMVTGWGFPSDFFCPISSQLMIDPVTGPDACTYDRTAIEKVLLFKEVSPITGLPLKKEQLISNKFVKDLIKLLVEEIDSVRKGSNRSLNASSFTGLFSQSKSSKPKDSKSLLWWFCEQ